MNILEFSKMFGAGGAGAIGAGIGKSIVELIESGDPTVLSSTWEGVIIAVCALIAAAVGAFIPRNKMTTDQVATAIARQPTLAAELSIDARVQEELRKRGLQVKTQ